MKTKRYELTQIEVMALREATIEYYHTIKQSKPNSPIALAMKDALYALKNQFSDDYRLWRDK